MRVHQARQHGVAGEVDDALVILPISPRYHLLNDAVFYLDQGIADQDSILDIKQIACQDEVRLLLCLCLRN